MDEGTRKRIESLEAQLEEMARQVEEAYERGQRERADAPPPPREMFLELPHWRFPLGPDGNVAQAGFSDTISMNLDKIVDITERVLDKYRAAQDASGGPAARLRYMLAAERLAVGIQIARAFLQEGAIKTPLDALLADFEQASRAITDEKPPASS